MAMKKWMASEVVLGTLGKGVRPAHQATESGPQGAKPTLDMADLAFSSLPQG